MDPKRNTARRILKDRQRKEERYPTINSERRGDYVAENYVPDSVPSSPSTLPDSTATARKTTIPVPAFATPNPVFVSTTLPRVLKKNVNFGPDDVREFLKDDIVDHTMENAPQKATRRRQSPESQQRGPEYKQSVQKLVDHLGANADPINLLNRMLDQLVGNLMVRDLIAHLPSLQKLLK